MCRQQRGGWGKFFEYFFKVLFSWFSWQLWGVKIWINCIIVFILDVNNCPVCFYWWHYILKSVSTNNFRLFDRKSLQKVIHQLTMSHLPPNMHVAVQPLQMQSFWQIINSLWARFKKKVHQHQHVITVSRHLKKSLRTRWRFAACAVKCVQFECTVFETIACILILKNIPTKTNMFTGPSVSYSLLKIIVSTSQDDEEYAVVVKPRLILRRKERSTTILRWVRLLLFDCSPQGTETTILRRGSTFIPGNKQPIIFFSD